jgi:hypothetical protein
VEDVMVFRNEGTVEFEGRVEVTTAKAYLVEMTLGDQVWVPKSQIRNMTEPDAEGNRMFTVTQWWAERNNMA